MIRFLSVLFLIVACSNKASHTSAESNEVEQKAESVKVGAEQLDLLIPLLQNKPIAMVVNHTAMVGSTHLVDTLLKSGINIKKIMAPEHGFRGKADAGETVKDGADSKTGLPIVSLYGNNKKPTNEQLSDVDIVVFDIQDVGVRFFTYISTLHYVMEACAENGKQVIVLDRPNPNGDYVDGPLLQAEHQSFVGMHPIPVVHGMTIGEYASMINGQGWIKRKCALEVIKLKHWKHSDAYSLPNKPSPNLPNDHAIRLYPSTCLFEGTVISVGRGTQMPFEVLGHPNLKNMSFSFTPISIEGMSKNPPFENKMCYGLDLQKVAVKKQLDLSYLIQLYRLYPDQEKFFIPYFEKLVGTSALREQIKNGMTEEAIRKTWEADLKNFMDIRAKYLLYQ
ncbi:DUF1343 domain-containing protein [Chryseotalea sanaruensis]|uniref:DUF1343 domain-containing protein n=1 Tax=Chryseotalea sanaruensis TaxID=2482724 RepID=A0A401UAJ9_9BACT|nr:DUF1343 domain-containing protein [Chryseotalea sanaruensis]GCC51936.1 DUF1343 domain-containing protein [Chryseotalea sanaruensis]